MKRLVAVASSMAFMLVMVLVMLCGLVGCGGGGASAPESPAVQTPAKTGVVKLRIDLNQQLSVAKMAKSAAKTAALTVEETQIVNQLKSDVSMVRIIVYTMDWNEVLPLNEPLVNGVFDSMRPDGTSKINLPAGDYQIYIGLENASDIGRFYGWTDLVVVEGQENVATVDLEVSPIEVGITIANFQGSFDKGDGSDSAPLYAGSMVTDDWMEYSDDAFAWVDAQGTLHATVTVNPLTSTKMWITVKDKDGANIVQALDLEMATLVSNSIKCLEVPYVFQKNNAVMINVNFPS